MMRLMRTTVAVGKVIIKMMEGEEMMITMMGHLSLNNAAPVWKQTFTYVIHTIINEVV